MKRGDKTVITISAALAVVAIVAVAYSLLVLDRKPRADPHAADSTSSLLVLTWAPSLCSVDRANSGCRSGHVNDMGRSFLLHGLWPQPSTEQYCDVPKHIPDRNRTPVSLPKDLQNNLQALMSDAAKLTTHEWYAHGTCSGLGAPEYFAIAAALTDQAAKVLDPVFAKTAGDPLSSRAVRSAFDAAFGAGAGARVALACRAADGQGDVAYEVRMSLPPVADLRDVQLGQALAKGPPIPVGCGQGRVPV